MALGIPNQLVFKASSDAFTIVGDKATPIIIDAQDPEAVRIAASNFALDVERVSGMLPSLQNDTASSGSRMAIIVGTVGSSLISRISHGSSSSGQKVLAKSPYANLKGQWETYDIRVVKSPMEGVDEALVICGSDRRGAIYGLYTLSEHMGVSPWYWWADVTPTKHDTVAFPHNAVYTHKEPTVKYRGFFLNDEQPVLWNWAKEHFHMGDKPPFQVGMYEKMFELCLRLKGNYMWPAMWDSMFAVDGQELPGGKLPKTPTPGPNQALADRFGVVMGTSHHEPMSRNQKEFTTWGEGDWSYTTNKDYLEAFWKYGAERAKGLETVYTVGMRGDGDLPLGDEDVPIIENITLSQQDILRSVHGDIKDVPQMWAMYKEVMAHFASGLKVPDEVTCLLADDNWGNLMAVMPQDRKHPAGGGMYYHADYVGDPRDYKWINTVPLAKMWEQLNLARSFQTDRIWILNVGDLKMLELPLQWFMSLAYDFDSWPIDSLETFLGSWASRDFAAGEEQAKEIASIMAKYSMLASRRKAEMIDSQTFSIVHFDESERILSDWADLETRAVAIDKTLKDTARTAFNEMVLTPIKLYSNLNRIYISAAKSNLYSTQSRTAANVLANDAQEAFEKDYELTEEYHSLENRKWDYMLCQPHINYQYWQAPMKNSMPPVSYVSKHDVIFDHGKRLHTRYTVENSLGAWPGDNKYNSILGYNAPDPTLLPMDRYGKTRWVEIGAGGPMDTTFTAKPREEWLKVSPSNGSIKGDGSTDTRVTISVDWEKFAAVDAVSKNQSGHIDFANSDGARMTVTVPILDVPQPPKSFKGAVQGDGYVAIEAAHCNKVESATAESTSYEWTEIPHYGRTHSGMAVFPPTFHKFDVGKGPAVIYDFWVHEGPQEVEVIIDIGPTNNFIIGDKLAFGIQMDDGEIQKVEPIPESKPGALSHDWEEIVASEIRIVRVPMKLGGKVAGQHRLTLYGITAGIVVERISIDLGGIKARSGSYLGAPESVIL